MCYFTSVIRDPKAVATRMRKFKGRVLKRNRQKLRRAKATLTGQTVTVLPNKNSASQKAKHFTSLNFNADT